MIPQGHEVLQLAVLLGWLIPVKTAARRPSLIVADTCRCAFADVMRPQPSTPYLPCKFLCMATTIAFVFAPWDLVTCDLRFLMRGDSLL